MNKYEYDVSIVVPVYNASEYLIDCIDSIKNQTHKFSKIQVILVDDGSIDNSLSICRNYSKKYKNIKLITQKNSGVSTARNNGIKSSLGKYIMLLDSDDTISKNTVENLFNFFENHYNDIDIVTYPIMFNRNGKITKNIRYDAYNKGTNIYDVNEYIYLNQSTVNIMIKNEGSKTNLYDTKMKLSEDQNFDTQLIMKKEKIGYVDNAIYYYRRYDGSVSSSRNNPFYCFDDIMSYNENLLVQYKKNNKIPKYIQSLVINTFKWRIRTDQLFPYYLENTEYDNALDRIKKIVKQIDVDVIMNIADMNLYHKIYFIKMSDRKIKTKIEGSINTYANDILIYSSKEITGNISKIKIKNDNILLMADLLNPILEEKKPTIYIEKKYKNNKIIKEEIDIKVSNESYFACRTKVTTSYNFDIKIPIKDLVKFKIYTIIDNKRVNIEFKFKKFAPNNFINGKYNLLYSKKSSCFKIRKNNIRNKICSRFRNFIYCLKNNKKASIYRIMYYLYPVKKNIWIYSDRGDSLDNGYTQFVNDFNKSDGINRYYVSNLDNGKLKRYFDKSKMKFIIKQGSLKHKMIYLHSKKIITSFVDLQVYCPFNTSVNYYNDITKYDLVYLQHGILHSNLVKMYSKEYTEIDKFIISTNFEKNNLINKYHYKEEDLICSGMPRMKLENNKLRVKNKILFAPSWRKYLIGDLIKNKRKLKKNDFINSNFYKEIYNFLHSDELSKFLKDSKLTLDFKLHPIFRDYSNLFDLRKIKNISLNFEKTNVCEYKIFITDFSSFQFDFVKLYRPIIYFMPDMKEFKAGLHTYRELDLDYKDAFGKLCLTNKALLNEIKRISKNEYKVDKKYIKKMNEFFLDLNNPCDDIYKELINMK